MNKQDESDRVLGNVTRALTMLESSKSFALLMPEVRVNMVYALLEIWPKSHILGTFLLG